MPVTCSIANRQTIRYYKKCAEHYVRCPHRSCRNIYAIWKASSYFGSFIQEAERGRDA